MLGSQVERKHKVILVPLLYSKLTDRVMALELNQSKVTNKISHQAYLHYNSGVQPPCKV